MQGPSLACQREESMHWVPCVPEGGRQGHKLVVDGVRPSILRLKGFTGFLLPSLLGHLSEDPKFPKVPWPTPDLCPACHEEIKGLDSWNEDQVLVFLKQHYSRDNLVDTYSVDQGSPGDWGDLGKEQEEGEGLNPSGKSWIHQDAESLRPPHILGPRTDLSKNLHHRLDLRLQSPKGLQALEEAKASVPFLGIGFSSLDMSLCVVLYVASSLFLMIMYFFFRVRSKRWKVRLYHPAV